LYRKPDPQLKERVALYLAQDTVAAAAKRAMFRHFQVDGTDAKRPREEENDEEQKKAEELNLLLDSAGRAEGKKKK
jgi:hypothetical protein